VTITCLHPMYTPSTCHRQIPSSADRAYIPQPPAVAASCSSLLVGPSKPVTTVRVLLSYQSLIFIWPMQMTTWLRLWDFHSPYPAQNGGSLVLNSGSIPGQIVYYSNKNYSSGTNAASNFGLIPTGKW
jgi:hypothetical protein